MNKTLVMIKPDCVTRRMVGAVITAIEGRGLSITAIQQKVLTKQQASDLYSDHKDKWHFFRNIGHITSGPSVVIRVEGDEAVERCKDFVEHFRKAHSDVVKLPRNLLHATSESTKADQELSAVGLNGA